MIIAMKKVWGEDADDKPLYDKPNRVGCFISRAMQPKF